MNKKILKSFSVVSLMTSISRVLGFVRDMVLAYFFGATAANDAFLVAFKIPNFMRGLFAEGAFAQAFVPVLSEYQQKNTEEETKQFIHATATSMFLLLLFVLLMMEAGAPFLVTLFAPGFLEESGQFELATRLLSISLPYLLLISMTALFGAVLNCWGQFAVPSFTPVFLNAVLIAAAAIFSHYFKVPITALAWGIFVAGIVQLLFQLPFLYRLGLFPRFQWFWGNAGVLKILKLMVPALLGVSVAQIGLLISTLFASFLPAGSISWLYYSERLAYFPLGIFGVALSTVIMPHLSAAHAKKAYAGFSDTMNKALQTMLLIGLPSSLALFIMAGPLLATLFEGGSFSSEDVKMASMSLQALAVGVPAFMSCKVLVSSFYSRQDIKTPVRIAVISLLANIILNAILIFPLKHAGLALATSLASWLNAGLLFYKLKNQSVYRAGGYWKQFLFGIALANGLVSILLIWGLPDIKSWLSWERGYRAFVLTAWIVSIIPLYFGLLKGVSMLIGQREKHKKLTVQETEAGHAE